MGQILLLALLAALNPTLVAASTLMMLMPNPRRLMLGYLLGALLTSITLGIVIVYTLVSTDALSTTKNTLSPAATMTLGVIALVGALVLGTAPRRRDHRPKKEKGTPRWQRALGKGSARTTFVVGALLTLPGGAYLTGLSRIDKLHYPAAQTVLVILAFNLIMLALLEVPLVCFTVAPAWTVRTIDLAKAWIGRHGRRVAVTLLATIGALLVIKALVELLT